MNSMFLQHWRIPFKVVFSTFLFFILSAGKISTAQKVKDYVLNVDYQAVPPYPLHVEYVHYLYKITEEYIDPSNQIKTLETWSTGHSDRIAFYNANLPSMGYFAYWKKQFDGAFNLDGTIGLAMLENKKYKSIARQNPTNPAAPATNAIVYELTYSLPFALTMKNAKDSVIFNENAIFEKQTTLIFPDDFGNLIPNFQNYVSQSAIEGLFVKNEMQIAKIAKDKIIANNFNQFSKIINKRHDEVRGNMGFSFYYLKDKKEEYPAFDSALAIMKIVCDSIKQNLKLTNYKNWHTKFVMEQTTIVDKIVNRLAVEYKTKLDNGTMDKELAEEIVFGLVKNKYAVMLLQNRYEEAIAEIEVYLSIGIFHKELSKVYLERVFDYFKEEQRRYLANKKFYKWM